MDILKKIYGHIHPKFITYLECPSEAIVTALQENDNDFFLNLNDVPIYVADTYAKQVALLFQNLESKWAQSSNVELSSRSPESFRKRDLEQRLFMSTDEEDTECVSDSNVSSKRMKNIMVQNSFRYLRKKVEVEMLRRDVKSFNQGMDATIANESTDEEEVKVTPPEKNMRQYS